MFFDRSYFYTVWRKKVCSVIIIMNIVFCVSDTFSTLLNIFLLFSLIRRRLTVQLKGSRNSLLVKARNYRPKGRKFKSLQGR